MLWKHKDKICTEAFGWCEIESRCIRSAQRCLHKRIVIFFNLPAKKFVSGPFSKTQKRWFSKSSFCCWYSFTDKKWQIIWAVYVDVIVTTHVNKKEMISVIEMAIFSIFCSLICDPPSLSNRLFLDRRTIVSYHQYRVTLRRSVQIRSLSTIPFKTTAHEIHFVSRVWPLCRNEPQSWSA